MAEEVSFTRAELTRQVQQHLSSLQAAGLEWLPTAPVPQVARTPQKKAEQAVTPAAPPPTPVVAHSLFEAQERIGTMASSSASSALTPESRLKALTVLADKVAQCTRCAELASTRTQTVFGEGPLDAELCFIGEAPGADEDATGRPFVGAAGQLLNRIITACGMKREEVYICNILRCRPPGNRLPLANEAANCREYLDGTLDLIRPKYICCMGACAAQNLLGSTLSIGKLRGKFHDYRGIIVACTYHPAYLLRNPSAKKDVWEDLKKLLAKMGRTVPGQ